MNRRLVFLKRSHMRRVGGAAILLAITVIEIATSYYVGQFMSMLEAPLSVLAHSMGMFVGIVLGYSEDIRLARFRRFMLWTVSHRIGSRFHVIRLTTGSGEYAIVVISTAAGIFVRIRIWLLAPYRSI